MKHIPIKNSYRVAERIYAGEYPRCETDEESVARINDMLRFGITDFIDLTEEGEHTRRGALLPYRQLLPPETGYYRRPIRDNRAPAISVMNRILGKINALLRAQRTIYVHCLGGVGRTSTVIMCWLMARNDYRSISPQFEQNIYEQMFLPLWNTFPKSKRRHPVNPAQQAFLMEFANHIRMEEQQALARIYPLK
jgi:hypothetical protein